MYDQHTRELARVRKQLSTDNANLSYLVPSIHEKESLSFKMIFIWTFWPRLTLIDPLTWLGSQEEWGTSGTWYLTVLLFSKNDTGPWVDGMSHAKALGWVASGFAESSHVL